MRRLELVGGRLRLTQADRPERHRTWERVRRETPGRRSRGPQRVEVVALLGALGMVGLFILAMTWASVAVGVAARTGDAASGFTFFVLFLPYLSSAFVPPETRPAALRPFAEHQLVTPVIEAVRGLLLGTPIGASAWIAGAWCVGIMAVAIPAAAILFRRRARR